MGKLGHERPRTEFSALIRYGCGSKPRSLRVIMDGAKRRPDSQG
jgi:hypothetical protein